MKKFLAIVLAVAMVLSIASVAMAFSWSAPAVKTDDESFGYKIEVIKFTRSTGSLGSSSFNIDSAATAVNGADVYFAIKLTVPDLAADKAVRKNAVVSITGTALGFAKSGTSPMGPFDNYEHSIKGLDEGVYYYNNNGQGGAGNNFWTISELNNAGLSPIFAVNCEDTDTAKVCAKVTSKRPLGTGSDAFNYGDYDIRVTDTEIAFWEAASPLNVTQPTGLWIATFAFNSDGKVTSVKDNGNPQKAAKLYAWLNAGSVDTVYNAVKNGEMYMTKDNIRAAFGYSYKSESCATWNANSTPIILDPTISIPKTGDNASVIGFAMIMVAVVAAAAAMKKVKA